MNLAIVGCRNYTNYAEFEQYVETFVKSHNIKLNCIISGGATGADKMAEIYASKHSIKIIIHKADWNKYGKRAGPIRNKLIIDDATHCIAFVSKNSVGTLITIDMAKNKGIPLSVIDI
jgi:predicted Rossmann fold nucleotide-binding protein DprA/Smf involved in DNA uptake